FPIHMFWTTDDPISNKRSIPSFWNNIKNSADMEIQKISPKEYSSKKIGHHGFFRKKFKDSIWPEALNRLNSFLVTDSTTK
ncbi:MAG: alpha/beta hydrolase, partial [Bacteroidota bacterium]